MAEHGGRSTGRRGLAAAGALAAAALAIGLASLAIGRPSAVPPLAAWAALLGQGSPEQVFIVRELRLPRVLMALLAGGMLALSGLLLQTLTRNPLAAPDTLGVSAGASLAAVFHFTHVAPGAGMAGLPLAAFGGGAAALACAYALAWQRGGAPPQRLVLAGVGLSAAAGALAIMLLARSPLHIATTAYAWLTGSVFGATLSSVASLGACLALLLPLLAGFARGLPLLALGDDSARGLGLPLARQRLLVALLAVGLAAAAIAHVGAMAFVGLVAGHLARRLGCRGAAALAAGTYAAGALLVAAADLAARTLLQPLDVPAGVFVAILGAGFFVYLLARPAARRTS